MTTTTEFPSEYKKAKAIMDAPEPVVEADPVEIPKLPGVTQARKHLMRCTNLMLLSMEAAKYTLEQWRERHHLELPNEHFQALCSTYFIEGARAGFVLKMPDHKE